MKKQSPKQIINSIPKSIAQSFLYGMLICVHVFVFTQHQIYLILTELHTGFKAQTPVLDSQ